MNKRIIYKRIDEDLVILRNNIGKRRVNEIPTIIAKDEKCSKALIRLLVNLSVTRNIKELHNNVCIMCDGNIEESRVKEAKRRGVTPSTCVKCDSAEFKHVIIE